MTGAIEHLHEAFYFFDISVSPPEDILLCFLEEPHFIHKIRLYHRLAVWETELRALEMSSGNDRFVSLRKENTRVWRL